MDGGDGKEKGEMTVKLWQQAIATQMHFAELSLKMRQLGLALAGATIALAITTHKEGASIEFPCGIIVPVSSVLCAAAALILFAARTIDVGVYHAMLRGAVKFNEILERDMDELTAWKCGLTETITAYSRGQRAELLPTRDEKGARWKIIKKHFAQERISHFYYITIGALVLAAVGLAFAKVHTSP